VVAVAHLEQAGLPEDRSEQRLVLRNVSFRDYVLLGDVLGHRPGLRMTYLEGALELMTTSPKHEQLKTLIARLVELYALLRGIRIVGFGSATYRREEHERGLEPDECYCIGTAKDVPDLAIEVVITNPLVDKLAVYRGLGVREVWVYSRGAFTIHALGESGYAVSDRSAFFPDLDFEVLAAHTTMPDQDDAVRAYWAVLRG
jgi:Uma2 family endonuclease